MTMAAIRRVLLSVFVLTITAVDPCSSSLSCNASDAGVRNITASGRLVMAHVMLSPGNYGLLQPSANGSIFSADNFSERYQHITRAGRQSLFNLGKWLRKRYESFLPFDYFPDHVLVRSSNSAKAVESVECVLATLFPPKGQNFNFSLDWQPIPIHAVPRDMDEILEARLCDRYESLLEKLKNSQEIEYLNRENWELYKDLSKLTEKKLLSIGDLAKLYDILEAEVSKNDTLPKWVAEFFPGQLLRFSILNYRIPTFTPELKLLKSGPFLKELARHIGEKVSGSLRPNRSLFIDSVNEATLASFLNALGIFNCLPPPKPAAVMVELWASDNQTFSVTVSYKNESTGEPYILKLPACLHVCPLDTFLDIMGKSIPRDWRNQCKSEEEMSEIVVLKTVCVFIVLLMLTLAIVLVRLCITRNNRHTLLR